MLLFPMYSACGSNLYSLLPKERGKMQRKYWFAMASTDDRCGDGWLKAEIKWDSGILTEITTFVFTTPQSTHMHARPHTQSCTLIYFFSETSVYGGASLGDFFRPTSHENSTILRFRWKCQPFISSPLLAGNWFPPHFHPDGKQTKTMWGSPELWSVTL